MIASLIRQVAGQARVEDFLLPASCWLEDPDNPPADLLVGALEIRHAGEPIYMPSELGQHSGRQSGEQIWEQSGFLCSGLAFFRDASWFPPRTPWHKMDTGSVLEPNPSHSSTMRIPAGFDWRIREV
jgi:hypothetical protein